MSILPLKSLSKSSRAYSTQSYNSFSISFLFPYSDRVYYKYQHQDNFWNMPDRKSDKTFSKNFPHNGMKDRLYNIIPINSPQFLQH